MFETNEELLQQIWLGEDTTLELKEVRFAGKKVSGPPRSDLADELAAIANTASGVVVLGIDDKTREVLGIPQEKLDIVETWIREICHDTIKPPLNYQIRRITLPDSNGEPHPIMRIDIPRSLFIHKSPGGYFRREGSSKREMEPDVLARMFQQRSQTGIIRFDEYIVPMCPLESLLPEKWSKFRTPLSPADDIEFLSKIKMISKDDQGNLKPTVSGVLMASDRPDEFIPNAFIQAVYYRGTERSADWQIDAKDIRGSLDEQVRSACDFVNKNMLVFAQKNPQRIEYPQYAMSAVFEAVVNAVAHRDYSIHGSKIRLHLFADKLEISSPGAIPNTMTIGSLPLRQVSRNETLTSLLARCPVGLDYQSIKRDFMMDKRGEGVPIIISESENLSGKRPEYKLVDESELVLTIYATTAPTDN